MTVLRRLKSETDAEHQSIEKVAVATGFLEDPRAYRKYLRAMFGFYAPVERMLAATPELERVLPDLRARRKLDWLRRDLEALGDDTRAIDALPLCRQLPRFDPAAYAVGAAYVVEGATLGGRFILDRLTRAEVAPGARAFFSGYGKETGPMWRAFTNAVAAWSIDREREDAIVVGANATFRALRLWLADAARS